MVTILFTYISFPKLYLRNNDNSFVNNPSFKYSKIRCILIGGSAGGSGGFGHNARLTGAGGGSGAYLSFDLFLDPPHSSSTLTLTAGGSGNGGRGANRSAGGVGGVGQLGASGLASSLSYYSGVNNQTSTFSANGGLRAEAQGLTGAAGTVSISANHRYNTIYSQAYLSFEIGILPLCGKHQDAGNNTNFPFSGFICNFPPKNS